FVCFVPETRLHSAAGFQLRGKPERFISASAPDFSRSLSHGPVIRTLRSRMVWGPGHRPGPPTAPAGTLASAGKPLAVPALYRSPRSTHPARHQSFGGGQREHHQVGG